MKDLDISQDQRNEDLTVNHGFLEAGEVREA